jgi:dTDP-glucose pyrophosphorylase/CBS domain-containing protein
MSIQRIEEILVQPQQSIRDAMERIDRGRRGIVLVVDEGRRLLGTVTDGDVRRAILANIEVSRPVSELLARKPRIAPSKPTWARVGTTNDELLELMHQRSLRQVPLLDNDGVVVDLVTIDELVPPNRLPVHAVVMAGGFGKRLLPLTEDLPKPMLPVNDKPMMEHIVQGLKDGGVQTVSVTTHYKAQKIIDHFGDGSRFGVKMDYVNEDQPAGTAGALALMPPPTQTLLVINGDVLTRIDLRAMLKFHRQHGAEMTVGLRQYDFQVPYGVVECQAERIRSLKEKPSYSFFVNAGVYLLEPSAHALIPRQRRFDMTDLVQALLDQDRRVLGFPIIEYWMDIGRMDDYQRAQEEAARSSASASAP